MNHQFVDVNSISHECPVKGGGSDDASLAVQGQVVQKWSILWRTVILSALGRTSYPYCRHLRMLDLRDLGYLLDDDKFKQGKISQQFFAGEMSRFHLVTETPFSKTRSKVLAKRLNLQAIISAIGDVVTQEAPLLEALTEPIIGDLFSTALVTWAPRLTHLRRLDFWDGRPFADETIRNLLYAHCPNLDSLRMYQSNAADADQQLASFIGGLQENTLVHFENISNCGVGPETCLALNRHGKSLSLLKLALTEEGVLALAGLQGCSSIETLAIESLRPSVDLKATQNDVFLEIVEWLRSCRSLRDVSLKNLVSAPDLLTPLLLNKDVQLETLQIDANDRSMYDLAGHRTFHEALSQQRCLRELFFSADGETATLDDRKALLDSLCSLTDLRTLTLIRASDDFVDADIRQLAQRLTHLETLYVGGFGITDDVWDSLARLRNLNALTFAGVTRFSANGILNFITQLSDGNRGMVLSLDFADTDNALAPGEEVLIRETMAATLGGDFRYQLLRGMHPPRPSCDTGTNLCRPKHTGV